MPSPAPGRTVGARIWLPLVLVLSLSACSREAEPAPPTPDRSAAAEQPVQPAARPVATATKIHRVYGRLPAARRKTLRHQVEKVVDRWWESAYLEGAYPRTAFPSAYPGFTAGAQKRARKDKALLTNQTGGARIESVTARKRAMSLDILAVDGHARSVTAHFVLRFRTTGAKEGTTVVRGRLFLTRRTGSWRIFGYDVTKGSRP